MVLGALALYAAIAIAWLGLGLIPRLAAAFPALHAWLHGMDGTSLLGEIAGNSSRASHAAGSGPQATFDYLFSAFNLGLAVFLLWLRPRDWAARLLAIGMVGTAVAFNLQGHDALQVVPVVALGAVGIWHEGLHVLSGVAYMFALLLFPDGKLVASSKRGFLRFLRFLRAPYLLFLTLIAALLSLVAVDDHTAGLVVVFGIFIPFAGVSSQLRRYRGATTGDQRRQSKLLVVVLAFALAAAAGLMYAADRLDQGREVEVVDYEVRTPAAGTYFFRCDPHPDTMTGRLVVTADRSSPAGSGPAVVRVDASNGEFDKSVIEVAPNQNTIIRFANHDADPHNVAIYAAADAREPLFIGRELSANDTAALAFRGFRVLFAAIPIALLIGLLRFRLWDVDRVITRAVVYGLFAAVITVIYLALVTAIGTVMGSSGGGNVVVSIALTAAIAVAFEPLRQRARRLANRLVYGERATPYEVLANLSQRVGQTMDTRQALGDMTRVLRRATGAARTEVWLRLGDELMRAAVSPGEAPVPKRLALEGEALPRFDGVDHAVAVRHNAALLGALAVEMVPGERLSPVEEKLVEDAASQLSLVLCNAQLTAELQARLDEISTQAAALETSRRRIVAAQDAARRELERDIHDGAQQQLIALTMKLQLAQSLMQQDPQGVQDLLAELQTETHDAMETLRELGRGIYPPILTDRGLVDALEAQARRSSALVIIDAANVGRYAAEIEASVYFCCMEAVQNATKYAGAVGPITVAIGEDESGLSFSITDCGRGFAPALATTRGTGLQNMTDRIAAVGGSLEIRSSPGEPTTIAGQIPRARLAPARETASPPPQASTSPA